jgi:pimeloyl-ACP methyl ester carboxylesterase
MTRPLPELPGVKHRFIDLPNLRMHVAEAGEGDPVVLLHGWPQNWWEWRRLIPLLSERFRVICPDLRGFGWSDAPDGPYDKETMADDVLQLLDALDLPRVRIIGHDIGGFVAFLICLEHPERVSHYMALNTGHPFGGLDLAALRTLWRFWYWPVVGAPLAGPWLVRNAFARALRRGSRGEGAEWSSFDAAVFADGIAEPARARASSRTYRAFLLADSPRVLSGRYRSQRLTVPTLMLHGLDDPVLRKPLLDGYQPFADRMQVEFAPGVGHFIAEEAPELVSERAIGFFAGS